ncbi:MAG: DEAD/DEAH box helicase family protein [Muribaculaceae bacterium]|nr:DEAD/DEAH box helicase family protein [Ruminococcus flavefaciens]MCM1295190.1 DEAD/DEAH box helicase family protein [Muribaculaceae bacterium]
MSDSFFQLIPKKYSVQAVLSRTHDKALIFRHGHIAITDYKMGDNPEFEKSLSSFDDVRWRYVMKAGYYIPELKEFRVNRGYDLGMLASFFKGYDVRVENDAYPADKVKIDLLAAPRDDFQRVGLTFMCSQEEYRKNSRYTQLMIDADTGDGKTYLGVATGCFMQARQIVFVPIEAVMQQWKESYLKFTSLKEKEVKIVQGSDTCRKILDGKYKDVKVFIFSVDTVVSFCERFGPLETIDMLRATNCYMKIVDEVHKDMRANAMIEALCNFHMNYYMSATPGRAQSKENWIFKTCYRNVPRFGSKFKVQEEKHINILVKKYKFSPTTAQIGRMVQKRKGWLNGKSYERELLNASDDQKEDFINSVRAMLNWSKKFLKTGNKILILCETIDGTAVMKELAEEIFPGEVSRYYGSMNKAEKQPAKEKTVICATVSSLGTGADIPGIQHVHNITTYANWISVIQTAGRARKLKDGTQVFYIEYVNFSYLKTIRQYEKRKPTLIKKSRTGKIMLID